MKSLLVSLKDGFSQSTKEDGNRTPEGQLILTSNKLPTLDERASSRILLNSFRKKGLQVSRKQQKALEDLKVKAWSLDQMILFFVYLGSGLEDQKETINDIKEIVKFMLPEIMERTAVDLSIQLFYSSKLLAVSGFGSFAQALRMFVDTQYNDVKKFHAAEIDFIPEASDAIHSLVALLEKELEDIEEQELMCFALPGVNTKVNEEKIKCVSIAIDFLNQRKMNSVDKNILHDFVIAKYGEKHWGGTDYFKKDGVSASHKTIRSRDKAKARGRKAFRIPEKCLPRLFVERLYHVCDILDQLEIPTLEAESEEESNENVIGKILEKHAENIRKIHDKIAKFDMSENSMLQEIGIFKEFDPYLYDVSLDRLHVTEELESMEGSSGYPSDGMESGDEGTGERLEETGADATDVVEVGEDVHESPVLNAKNIPTQLQGVDKIRSVDEEQESCGTNDGPNKRSSEQRTGFSPASKSGRIDSDPNRNTVRRNLDFDDDTANASKVNQKGKTEKKKYVYCICKKRRNKNVEKGMLLCETDDRDMCPGKGYYHKHCLGYKEVPKESPWLCGSCKSKGGSEIYDATSTLDESESASA